MPSGNETSILKGSSGQIAVAKQVSGLTPVVAGTSTSQQNTIPNKQHFMHPVCDQQRVYSGLYMYNPTQNTYHGLETVNIQNPAQGLCCLDTTNVGHPLYLPFTTPNGEQQLSITLIPLLGGMRQVIDK